MSHSAPFNRACHTPGAITRPAPLTGEHTTEVLRELGLDSNDLGALAAAGATVLPTLQEQTS